MCPTHKLARILYTLFAVLRGSDRAESYALNPLARAGRATLRQKCIYK